MTLEQVKELLNGCQNLKLYGNKTKLKLKVENLELNDSENLGFVFHSYARLAEGNEKGLYGLWLFQKVDGFFKNCPCMRIKLLPTEQRSPSKQPIEAHVVEVKVDKSQLEGTNESDLRTALKSFDEFLGDFIKEDATIRDAVKAFNENSDSGIQQYAENRRRQRRKENDGYQSPPPPSENKKDKDQSPSSPEPLKDAFGNILPRNLIYFGAPGTGKSFKLKEAVEAKRDENGKPVEEDKNGTAIDYERVTFYPTYSYAQFVGCYKPTMKSEKAPILPPERLVEELKTALVSWPEWIKVETDVTRIKAFVMLLFGEKFYDSLEPLKEEDLERIRKDAGAKTDYDKAYLSAGMAATKVRRRTSGTSGETIVYKFVPGSFLRILVKALNNPQNNYCLVIEEINRANAAAVFGDVFQLLDRDSDGRSEYEVAASEDVKKFLLDVPEKGGLNDEGKKALGFNGGEQEPLTLKIPPNMYIWATMNSADQGVFPMDTAFKRRWEFEYVGIDKGVTDKLKTWTIGSTGGPNWNSLRMAVNGLLSSAGVNEDKLMGPWFVKPENGSVVSEKQFTSKVLMYLWEDAARMCRKKIFIDDVSTFSGLISKWEGKDGNVAVFKLPDNVKNRLNMGSGEESPGAGGGIDPEGNGAKSDS